MNDICTKIMDFLGVNEEKPSLDYLVKVFEAYLQKVPWENVSRLLKYRNHNLEDCPRLPEEFWSQAIEFGTGGTCFDSNGAFFQLLKHIGYKGYLTINNVPAEPEGTHGAVVIFQDGHRWLIDVGYPLHSMLNLDHRKKTSRESVSYSIQSEPVGIDEYLITNIGHNGEEGCFTLRDKPVSCDSYRQADLKTYILRIFLDKILISKMINGQLYSFDSDKGLAKLTQKGAIGIPLPSDFVNEVSTIFGVNGHLVKEAYKSLGYTN